ncbi:hypothetical protein B9Z19DRAFT_1133334 [Tuber borchii]|uniref:Uncharacterized protein n=1 Tax=Tuber borchii TaxID=42251 RepID=A0A2T6ZG10_TUBBO|nr:hypothetical protein B9Z19DRAFT_1133334 [Tuber borchii]
MPVSLKRRQHLRAIAQQRLKEFHENDPQTTGISEEDSCDREGSDTDCDVSDNESDPLEETEIESEDENESGSHRKKVKTLNDLIWDEGAGESMRQSYGLGSRKTLYNYRKNKRELAFAAGTSYNIKAVFQRQIDLGISLAAESEGGREVAAEEIANRPFRQIAMEELPRGGPGEAVIAEEKDKKNLEEATKELGHLSTRKSEQVRRYGGELTGHLLLRYQLVHSFYLIQKKCKAGWRAMALQVANSCGHGYHTARMIIHWERSWREKRIIPARRIGSNGNQVRSIFEDEDILLAVREYMEKSGEGLTSRKLAEVINCYVKNRAASNSDLSIDDGIDLGVWDIEERINYSLQRTGVENDVDTGSLDIRKRKAIVASTVRRWLRKQGLNWRDVKKEVYVDGHE